MRAEKRKDALSSQGIRNKSKVTDHGRGGGYKIGHQACGENDAKGHRAALEDLRPSGVIVEGIPGDAGIVVEIADAPDLGPGAVDPEGDDGQQKIAEPYGKVSFGAPGEGDGFEGWGRHRRISAVGIFRLSRGYCSRWFGLGFLLHGDCSWHFLFAHGYTPSKREKYPL
uniref:Uncharacterized protein n=1 Tax=Candidatus Kentrum eta TaxID=2126337 RepID=A0A450UN58_9GAMM|nr:MAG: hypothetical protein BECKH772A_GA0070896_1006417 [Candidatus Kentron sp. H]VFJ94750.1 MAG: hypothetical protein BECKH772B_GA0070898_1006617 [Candidatus Kentron sp. H]VFK01354.1 MAG: hypothetical protein BECKH772C_GA0070978_1006316 [Candidatus Kentron sp. H]